jgi:hypothetical protein
VNKVSEGKNPKEEKDSKPGQFDLEKFLMDAKKVGEILEQKRG